VGDCDTKMVVTVREKSRLRQRGVGKDSFALSNNKWDVFIVVIITLEYCITIITTI